MPSQIVSSVENNFTKGLITEFTGMNFPENAATDADNCIFTIVGDTTRRLGINLEDNFSLNTLTITNNAINTYKWNNVGGDGNTQLIVSQIGGTVYFYSITNSTVASPLSANKLAGTITLSSFVASGGSVNTATECQFTDGNGYLFIFHPSCDPIYVTYTAGTIAGNRIVVQVRDFNGIPDGLQVNSRPSTLSNEHKYNLINQGWSSGVAWASTSSSTVSAGVGSKNFTIATGLTISVGTIVIFTTTADGSPGGVFQPAGSWVMSGTVSSYTPGTGALIVNIPPNCTSTYWDGAGVWADWRLTPSGTGQIDTWFTAINNYPSNADVWWYFKNASGVYDPATTVGNVTLSTTQAPQGHILLEAFNQQRSVQSGVGSITPIVTTVRPRTGTWFQGRVWYTGIDAQQAATGDAPSYSWTENIYFSQIVLNSTNFGTCYQENDPTSDTTFGLLPTDGGIIQIQGCGSVYRLFPIQNGLLVFAANGIWFVTGNRGIGFSADDYTITKLSSVRGITTNSFVNVNGLPYFWNEEGIYTVTPTQGGQLEVTPITVGTILTFYEEIPLSSKKYVKGDYDPIEYIIKWVYKSDEATSVSDRYKYDKVLCFNTYNKSFYTYTVDNSFSSINGIVYVTGPGGVNTLTSQFYYFSSVPYSTTSGGFTFAQETDTRYVDWTSSGFPQDYTSYFITGYKLHGQAQKRFQIPYIYVYSKADTPTSYTIQGIWDYAANGNSGRWSTAQRINNWTPNFNSIFRRHVIRGRGLILQLKVSSVQGQPFDIMGWSVYENVNQGI